MNALRLKKKRGHLANQENELSNFKREVGEMLSEKESNMIEDTSNETVNKEHSENGILNQCEKCDFVGKTEGGLKTHVTAKHKTVSLRGYRRVT